MHLLIYLMIFWWDSFVVVATISHCHGLVLIFFCDPLPSMCLTKFLQALMYRFPNFLTENACCLTLNDVLFVDNSDPWNPHLATLGKVTKMLYEIHKFWKLRAYFISITFCNAPSLHLERHTVVTISKDHKLTMTNIWCEHWVTIL